MFGFLVIDKPAALTSRTAMNRVSGLIKPIKVGHAGTLDPLATGVLVLCIGPATRLVSLVQSMRKSYRATFRLGFESETEDLGSPLIPVAGAKPLSESALREVLPTFAGPQLQQPPQYSALRLQGRRAYDLARAGTRFNLKPREICVHHLKLVGIADDEFELDIECGSGTYIRSLGRDIGRQLGSGAVMTRLRRTAVGSFSLTDAVDVSRWDQATEADKVSASLIEPKQALAAGLGLRELVLQPGDLADLWHGRRLKSLASRVSESGLAGAERVLGVDSEGRLVAILKQPSDRSEPEVEVNFVRSLPPS